MKILQLKSLAKWLPMLLLPLLFAACSDNDEPEKTGEDVVEPKPLTSAQMAYLTLAGNYFDTKNPSVGTALDEAKPNERSKVAETVELALEDFERYLPKSKDAEQFIKRSENTVSIELDTLGSVKFEPTSGEGVVARVEVNLKEKQDYTVLYRTKASFSENNDGVVLSTYHPGDIVEIGCILLLPTWDDYELRSFTINGVVINASEDKISVFTDHRFQYKHKSFTFDTYVVSLEGWEEIYNAMQKYRDDFKETYYANKSSSANELWHLFNKSKFYKGYVCIDGNGFQTSGYNSYSYTDICWTNACRLSVKDLRKGNFSDYEFVYYIKSNSVQNIDCAYYNLINIYSGTTSSLRLIWSSHN